MSFGSFLVAVLEVAIEGGGVVMGDEDKEAAAFSMLTCEFVDVATKEGPFG